MIPKPFDDIEKDDIVALIDNGVTECKTIEYKQELPGHGDGEKKEFLADVSAFANAGGGDIIYGVKERIGGDGKNTGIPEDVCPIADANFDQQRLRLDGMIRSGIAPRLLVNIKEVLGWGEHDPGFVMLVRVPNSLASPHMVTFQGTSRFYIRTSGGKGQLDVGEIRAAFLATESQAERIRRFREDRLGQIVADEGPVALEDTLRLVLHVIPLTSFLNNERVDLTDRDFLMSTFPLPTFRRSGQFRRNLDGFLAWRDAQTSGPGLPCASSYCQVFFHGAVEAVVSGRDLGEPLDNGQNTISDDYEVYVVEAVEKYLLGYKEIGVTPPVVMALSLLGCKGACMWRGTPILAPNLESIDRDAAIVPEVIVDSLDVDVSHEMKPIFDAVWNACGHPRSLNYDEEGKWNRNPS